MSDTVGGFKLQLGVGATIFEKLAEQSVSQLPSAEELCFRCRLHSHKQRSLQAK